MDFIETLVRDTLHDAAEQAQPPSVLELPNDIGRPKRRLLLVLAAAAAVVVVVVGAGALGVFTHDGGSPPAHQKLPPATTVQPGQLVGFGNVALPIPDGWTYNDFICDSPQSDTIAVQPLDIQAACLGPYVEGVSTVTLDDLDSATASRWQTTATTPITLQDGTEALYGATTDEVGRYITVVVVPSLDAIAFGISPAPAMLDDILRALMPTPAGQVAIPQIYRDSWTEASATLLGLGLVVERREVGGIASAISTDPPAGFVVTKGSTVIVLVHR